MGCSWSCHIRGGSGLLEFLVTFWSLYEYFIFISSLTFMNVIDNLQFIIHMSYTLTTVKFLYSRNPFETACWSTHKFTHSRKKKVKQSEAI